MVAGLIDLIGSDYRSISYTAGTNPSMGGLERLPVPAYGEQLPIPAELRGGERRKMEKRLRLNRFLANLAEKTEKMDQERAEIKRAKEEEEAKRTVFYQLPAHIKSTWPLRAEDSEPKPNIPAIISVLFTQSEYTEKDKQDAAVFIQAVWRRHVRNLSKPKEPKVSVTGSSRRLNPKLAPKKVTKPKEFNLTTTQRCKPKDVKDQTTAHEETKPRPQDAVDIARAALEELWEVEGIEAPPKTPASAIITRPNSSRLIAQAPTESTAWATSHNTTGSTWSKSKLERGGRHRPAPAPAAARTESIDFDNLRPEEEAPLIDAARKEEDPPLSAAMLAVLKRRIKQSDTLKQQLSAISSGQTSAKADVPTGPSASRPTTVPSGPSFSRPTKSWRQRQAETESELSASVETSSPRQQMWPKRMPVSVSRPASRRSSITAVPASRPEGETKWRRPVLKPTTPSYVVLDSRPESSPQTLVAPTRPGTTSNSQRRGNLHSLRDQHLAAMGRHQVSPKSSTWGAATFHQAASPQMMHMTMPAPAGAGMQSTNPRRWSNPAAGGRANNSLRVERSMRSWA